MPPAVARRCDAVADRCLPVFKVCFFGLHECRFYFAKIMKGECNSKSEKRSFSGFDTAEPHLILCKDNERWVQQQAKRKFSFIL